MEEKILITRKELSERWGVTIKCIDDWRRDGILQTVKGIPTPRFNIQYIRQLEETELKQFSPLEKRRLERELKETKAEVNRLKEAIIKITNESNKALNLVIT
ncbi:histidine kinase [Clostridium perfringens]|uniref:histidine kinase n=1 Tax=Clostridium perfringens TaxID=1502 RepID=UPI000F527109|nr:histidine kinase [Clostridium perfringens]MDK0734779.1 histidine kinase [Clostridium perfringens]MEA5269392.1 histidine kinase [Clostridium perfringens]MEA5309305.1 histidine kinase [Clostridium perfringens]MEA5339872.1 histidine kinase [Clostridium perfringens]